MKIKIDKIVLVEGRYDKIKLDSVYFLCGDAEGDGEEEYDE